jgi:hypothetical protein
MADQRSAAGRPKKALDGGVTAELGDERPDADTGELLRIGEASGDPDLERVMVRIAGGAPDDELAAALDEAERAASAEAQA